MAEKAEVKKAEAKPVEAKATVSPEEKAAERVGVSEERLDDKAQNRAPKNEFEKENQKVTEAERKAAQKVSDMSTEKRIETAAAPEEIAAADAKDTGAAIAAAISAGLKDAKGDGFELKADEGVEPRFSVVKNKSTGEVFIRENDTKILSKIQLKSIEEQEASIQDQEVEEL